MKTSQLSVRVDSELLEKIRDIVYWEPGITLSQFVEEALYIKTNLYIHKKRLTKNLNPGRKVT